MGEFFKAQNYFSFLERDAELPIYIGSTFDFFRCVEFKEDFYGVIVSKLFEGNLRESQGRYSKLFPNQKISYWSSSVKVARKEIKSHGAGNNILTFWAYDDCSSSFPTLLDLEPLIILDGRKTGVQYLIDKIDNDIELDKDELEYMKRLLFKKFDAIAYESKIFKGGENYIFLESGFKKLSLREVRLRFGKKEGGAHSFILCAGTSDYNPYPDSYGKYFAKKAKKRMNNEYLNTNEYKQRMKCKEYYLRNYYK